MKVLLIVLTLGISLSAKSSPGEITAEGIPYVVHVDAKSSANAEFTVKFNLQREISRDIVTNETVTVPLCLDVPVDSSFGDWKNYWNESNSSEDIRAQSLSVAIQGLDQSSALQIVRHGLFNFRPRYWSEFDQQMKNAESALRQMGIAARFYDAVTVQFGSQNAQTLGFWVDANCRMNNVTRQTVQTVIAHEPAGILPRHYSVRVMNPVLQAFEQDNFNLVLGYNPNDVTIPTAAVYNTYTPQVVQDNFGTINVTLFAERNKVEIPSDALSGTLVRTAAGFSAVLTIDQNYLPQNDPGSTLVGYYELCSSWLLSCKTLDETKVTITMTSNRINAKIDGNFEPQQKYRIRYRFHRTASQFYSSYETEGLTNKLRF